MKSNRYRWIPGLLAFALAGCGDVPPSPQGPDEGRESQLRLSSSAGHSASDKLFGEAVPDSTWIVLFNRDMVVDARARAQEVVTTYGGELRLVYEGLQGFSARLPAQAIEGLRHSPIIRSISPNHWVIPFNHSEQSSPTWGLDRIDQRNLLLDSKYVYADKGSGVNVYVIDTGIKIDHFDFDEERASHAQNLTISPSDGDCSDHGTPIASIAAGATYGVAKKATIHNVKVLDCLNDKIEWVIKGVEWVRDNRAIPAVANLSVGAANCGGGGGSDPGGAHPKASSCVEVSNQTLDNAVSDMIAAGVTAVVAAGNSGTNGCNFSPQRVPEAITVASSTMADSRWTGSNYGSCIDLFAPGEDIQAASSSGATMISSGTSLSAPFVTGAAALYLEDNPSATPAQVSNWIVNQATTGALSGDLGGAPNRLLFSLESLLPSATGPYSAYEETVTVSSTLYGEAGGHSYYYDWDYRWCYNGTAPGDCDYVWHDKAEGWDVTSVQGYVRAGDYWVDFRVRVRYLSDGPDVGESAHRVLGAGEGDGPPGPQFLP